MKARTLTLLAVIIAMAMAAMPATAAKFSGPLATGYQPQDDIERSLWAEMDGQEEQTASSKFLITDPVLNGYVRSILCNTVGQEKCKAARIYILRTPQFNAMMAPNGMMIVWSGLLLRTRNEAELATVLAHEFAHFERQHSLQSFRDLQSKTDAMAWLSMLPYGLGTLGQFDLVGSVFAFNRDMERQADMLALDYISAAGYDPMAASDIWAQLRAEMDATAAERKTKSLKDFNGGFFASHPSTLERMEYLKAAALRKPAGLKRTGAAQYREKLADWWPRLINDQIRMNDFGATEFLLSQLASDGWTPELYYARGELYRARGKAGDFKTAAGYYREAVKKVEILPESWRGLGLALLREGDAKGGQKALKTYLSRAPGASDFGMISQMVQPQ